MSSEVSWEGQILKRVDIYSSIYYSWVFRSWYIDKESYLSSLQKVYEFNVQIFTDKLFESLLFSS